MLNAVCNIGIAAVKKKRDHPWNLGLEENGEKICVDEDVRSLFASLLDRLYGNWRANMMLRSA